MIEVSLTDGGQDILLSTMDGQSIRFKEEQVRPMGRDTMGVIGIRLEEDDAVVSMQVLHPAHRFSPWPTRGWASAPASRSIGPRGRGGRGLITMKTTERTGRVGACSRWWTRTS